MLFFLCLQVICVVFVCAAFTLDIFCLIFVPLHWLFFVASTYVLFNYIWHTGECVDYCSHTQLCFSWKSCFFFKVITRCVSAEKGICISTVSLWILLVYTEASLRLKDLKTSHANLSHLFAAHWYVDSTRVTISFIASWPWMFARRKLRVRKFCFRATG